MGHSMIGINRRTLAVIVVFAVGVVIAVSVFNVSWNTLWFLALIGFMFLMHGGHGGCGSHGGHQDHSDRDEHARHTIESTRDNNARAIAPDTNARGLASDRQAKSVKPEESHRHHGC